MTKESLVKIREFLIFGLADYNTVDIRDRGEVMEGLDALLNVTPKEFEENVKTLVKANTDRKQIGKAKK